MGRARRMFDYVYGAIGKFKTGNTTTRKHVCRRLVSVLRLTMTGNTPTPDKTLLFTDNTPFLTGVQFDTILCTNLPRHRNHLASTLLPNFGFSVPLLLPTMVTTRFTISGLSTRRFLPHSKFIRRLAHPTTLTKPDAPLLSLALRCLSYRINRIVL